MSENKRRGDCGNKYQDISVLHRGPEEAEGMNSSFFLSVTTADDKKGVS